MFALKKYLFAFALFCLLAGAPFASEVVQYGSSMNLYEGRYTLDTDAYYGQEALFRASSSGAPNTIFLPRGADTSDLQTTIYTCPGNFDYLTNTEGVFYLSNFISKTPYFPAEGARSYACGVSTDYLTCLATEWPTPSPSSNAQIQWASGTNLLEQMYYDDSASATRNENLWNMVQTNANINTDYYPSLESTYYPNNRAKAGIICDGKESVSLDGSGRTRSDGEASPAPIKENNREYSWNIPRLSNNGGTITLGSVSYPGSTYILQSKIENKPDCAGAIQILPEEYDAYDAKYFYTLGSAGFADQSPIQYTIHVVEPDTCEAKNAQISPNTIGLGDLNPDTDYNVAISLYNPYLLFDLNVTGVRIKDPARGWAVAGNNIPLIIASDTAGVVEATLTSPAQLERDVDQVCLIVEYKSAVEFCDGNFCTNESEVCINLNPRMKCNITTTPSPPALEAGDSLVLTTNCFLDGYPYECPQLSWEATGFEDAAGQQNISFLHVGLSDGMDMPVGYRYDPPHDYPFVQPFIPSKPNALLFYTLQPIPSGLLQTYGWENYPNITSSTDHGNVVVSGTFVDENINYGFNCDIFSSSGGYILVDELTPPDLVPVLSDAYVSGPSTNVDEIHRISWGVKNIAHAQVSTPFSINVTIDTYRAERIVSSLAAVGFSGDTVTYTYDFACPHPGLFYAVAQADIYDDVNEQNEQNNKKKIWINCGQVMACPDYI